MRLLAALLTCLIWGLPAWGQSLQDLDGQARSVPELVAQPGTEAVVLVVWCSRCASCRGVERELDSYASANGSRVKVYAVDAHPADSADRIRGFLTGQGLDFKVLRDSKQALVNKLKINKTTTALVYDKKGQLRYFGPFQGEGKGYAQDAVEEVLAGREVSMKSRPLRG